MNNAIRVLLLAGGASRRMGQPKSLLPWGEKSVIRHLLQQIKLAGCSQILVVSGAHHPEITRDLQDSNVFVHRNPNWKNGMGSSINCGLKEIRRLFPNNDKVLILLADQPLIDSDYLTRIMERAAEAPNHIVATAYPEGPGVPALFPMDFLDILQSLSPEQGARAVLRDPKNPVALLDPGEKAADMDTMQAYRALKSKVGLT